jgi:4,5-DOPA dioxygenase extradiol
MVQYSIWEVKMDSKLMPVLFIGHGSPMNALEDNEFTRGWINEVKTIPRPKGILCISAHWETQGVQVTAMPKPRTIHDFSGFPPELYEKQYPAPGSPKIARRVIEIIGKEKVVSDKDWGLDHGTWSVLCRMYPEADVPVVQLSLDRSITPARHFELGQKLQILRKEGILILGSGNVVHNLAMIVWENKAFEWAVEFDSKIKQHIIEDDLTPLIQYENMGRSAALSINSAEHYLPLLYTLGAKEKGEPIHFFNEKIWGGSLSMRCIRFG